MQLGNTALHYAVNVGNLELVRLLLDNKADPNAENNNGTTPLAYAKANQNGIPAGPLGTATGADIAALLRQRGALDVLPDWDRITVSRPSAKYSAAIFFKGTNDWNQFTLFDLLGVQYDLLTASTASASRGSRLRVAPYGAGSPGMENPLTFPDFTRIIIHRPSAEGTNWNELKINLARSLDSGDCAGDVPLQFGDVVEIPEADHVINEFWTGLSTNELFTLKSCLTRHLQITVNGQTTNIIVAPQVLGIGAGKQGIPAIIAGSHNAAGGWYAQIRTVDDVARFGKFQVVARLLGPFARHREAARRRDGKDARMDGGLLKSQFAARFLAPRRRRD